MQKTFPTYLFFTSSKYCDFIVVLRAHSQADRFTRQDRKHQEVTHKQAVY